MSSPWVIKSEAVGFDHLNYEVCALCSKINSNGTFIPRYVSESHYQYLAAGKDHKRWLETGVRERRSFKNHSSNKGGRTAAARSNPAIGERKFIGATLPGAATQTEPVRDQGMYRVPPADPPPVGRLIQVEGGPRSILRDTTAANFG